MPSIFHDWEHRLWTEVDSRVECDGESLKLRRIDDGIIELLSTLALMKIASELNILNRSTKEVRSSES